MKKILLPMMALIYSASISAAPTTLDCQSSSELDENLRDIAAATTGGASGADECPAPAKELVNNLCYEVENRATDEDEESIFNHRYEKTLWSLSCAKPGIDNIDIGKQKVQNMWLKHHKHFTCNRANFVVADGNVLKYGVQQNFEAFLFKIVKDYKLNINFKDPKDGKTVLDFTIAEYNKYLASSPNSQKIKDLKKTIDFLKENGAKEAKDI